MFLKNNSRTLLCHMIYTQIIKYTRRSWFGGRILYIIDELRYKRVNINTYFRVININCQVLLFLFTIFIGQD